MITLDDVRAARSRIAGGVRVTPMFQATLARTRLIAFNCNEHWKDAGTGKDLFDYVRDTFTPHTSDLEINRIDRDPTLPDFTTPGCCC